MKLQKLQVLAESPVTRSDVARARKHLELMDSTLSKFEAQLNGSNLKDILKDGGFPDTEANELKKKFKALYGAFEDFQMGVLVSTDE